MRDRRYSGPTAELRQPRKHRSSSHPDDGGGASASGSAYRWEVSSVTMSAADCGYLASATLCPAHIESASISPVVPAIGGAGSQRTIASPEAKCAITSPAPGRCASGGRPSPDEPDHSVPRAREAGHGAGPGPPDGSPGIGSASDARQGAAGNGSAKYCVSCATKPRANSMMLTEWVGSPS